MRLTPRTPSSWENETEVGCLNWQLHRQECSTNRWKLTAWTTMVLLVLTLALAAFGLLGAPLAFLIR